MELKHRNNKLVLNSPVHFGVVVMDKVTGENIFSNLLPANN